MKVSSRSPKTSIGVGFEPWMAQLVEHWSTNPKVVGSNPTPVEVYSTLPGIILELEFDFDFDIDIDFYFFKF